MKHKVKTNEPRVDQYLTVRTGKSRSAVQKWLKSGLIRVNGVIAKPALNLCVGDVLEYPTSESSLSVVLPEFDKVFEDASILVLNKPCGVIVHSGIRGEQGTLVDALKAKKVPLSTLGDEERYGIVHRLDRFTEGLMVVAKTNQSYEALVASFQAREVEKKYFAVVHGVLKKDSFEIDLPIGRRRRERHKMGIGAHLENAKSALTAVIVLKRFTHRTLLEVSPKTGRTHQIRVHLAHLGYPVLGDPVYLSKNDRGEGQFLQSFYLAFPHPKTGKRMVFELPMSERIRAALV